MTKSLAEQLKAFQERMNAKRKAEEETEKIEADKKRTEYLARTGRREMKP